MILNRFNVEVDQHLKKKKRDKGFFSLELNFIPANDAMWVFFFLLS